MSEIDWNAPCIELMIVRSNALLAAALTLQASTEPMPQARVEQLAREYEAFINRPVTEDGL